MMPPGAPDRAPAPADLILCGRVLTMAPGAAIIENGAVAISNTRIAAVGSRDDILRTFRADRLIDEPGAILLPGFTDCHTHSTQALTRGLIAGELPMIYRLYIPGDMSLTPQEAHLGAKLCATQLALSGVTSVCDFASQTSAEHEEAIIAAFRDVGLRLTFLRGNGDQKAHHAALYAQISDRSFRTVREGEAARDLMRTEALLKRAEADETEMFAAGVCPSGLLGFSDAYFQEGARLAARYGATLQVHAARDREEVEFSLACFGRRPIEQLAELGVIGPNLVVVHAILASDGELALLGRGGAGVAHSAVECVNILNRIPSVARMRAAGITVGLGCDNAVNDMFSVMQTALGLQAGIHGLETYEPDLLSAWDLLRMATIDAAALVGRAGSTGSIVAGKRADLIVIDGSAPHLFPIQDLASELVRFGSRANVRHVFVGGRAIVTEFRNATVDWAELAAAVAPIARKVHGVVDPRRYRPLRLCC